jgi:hypothetical protein
MVRSRVKGAPERDIDMVKTRGALCVQSRALKHALASEVTSSAWRFRRKVSNYLQLEE